MKPIPDTPGRARPVSPGAALAADAGVPVAPAGPAGE